MQRGERRKERFIPSYLKFRKSSPPSQRWLARCLNLTFLSWQKFMLNKVSPPAQPPRGRSSCLFCLHYNLLYIASFQKLSHYTFCRLIPCQNLLSGSKIFITSFNMAFFLKYWSPFRPVEEREKVVVVSSYICNFSPNHIWIQDFGRRPLYESVRWTKGDISHCSWLLALENSLIGLGGRE